MLSDFRIRFRAITVRGIEITLRTIEISIASIALTALLLIMFLFVIWDWIFGY